MTRTAARLSIAIICFSFFACVSKTSDKTAETPPAFDKANATKLVDSLNQKFSSEIAASDSTSLGSHYWPDAELMLDNMDPIKGSDVTMAWGGAIRSGIRKLNLTTTDVKGTDDLIIETGAYEMKTAQDAPIDKGKYVVIWEKRNGEWRIYRDIGCTSMPRSN